MRVKIWPIILTYRFEVSDVLYFVSFKLLQESASQKISQGTHFITNSFYLTKRCQESPLGMQCSTTFARTKKFLSLCQKQGLQDSYLKNNFMLLAIGANFQDPNQEEADFLER